MLRRPLELGLGLAFGLGATASAAVAAASFVAGGWAPALSNSEENPPAIFIPIGVLLIGATIAVASAAAAGVDALTGLGFGNLLSVTAMVATPFAATGIMAGSFKTALFCADKANELTASALQPDVPQQSCVPRIQLSKLDGNPANKTLAAPAQESRAAVLLTVTGVTPATTRESTDVDKSSLHKMPRRDGSSFKQMNY